MLTTLVLSLVLAPPLIPDARRIPYPPVVVVCVPPPVPDSVEARLAGYAVGKCYTERWHAEDEARMAPLAPPRNLIRPGRPVNDNGAAVNRLGWMTLVRTAG